MVVLVGCTFAMLSLFQGAAVPVLLAVALAYALNPVVSWLTEKNLKRTWATTLVFTVLSLFLFAWVLYLIPALKQESQKVPAFLEKAAVQLVPWLEARLGVSVPEYLHQRTEEMGSEAASLAQSIGPTMARWASAFASNTARWIAALLGLLVVPVLGFFFLMDYPEILQKGRLLLPRRYEALLVSRFSQVDEVLSAFVRGQLSVGLILSVWYSIGLSVALVDMAIVIGFLAGFGNMVPYLGTAVGLVFASLGTILNWQGPWQLAVVLLTFVLGQVAEGTVITPRVVGEQVGLPPVVVIIAILAFGELFGFVGILLAVPASAVLKVVGSVVLERYRKMSLYTGGA
jgi:predicted PurR-regulated permease PerM